MSLGTGVLEFGSLRPASLVPLRSPGAPAAHSAVVRQCDRWKMLRPAGLVPLVWPGALAAYSAVVRQCDRWKMLRPAGLVPLGWPGAQTARRPGVRDPKVIWHDNSFSHLVP
jgi:hypothetical protein